MNRKISCSLQNFWWKYWTKNVHQFFKKFLVSIRTKEKGWTLLRCKTGSWRWSIVKDKITVTAIQLVKHVARCASGHFLRLLRPFLIFIDITNESNKIHFWRNIRWFIRPKLNFYRALCSYSRFPDQQRIFHQKTNYGQLFKQKSCQFHIQNESNQIGFWNILQWIVSKLYLEALLLYFP